MSQQAVRGYRRKPAWIVAVAILFILAPFGNFLYAMFSLGYRKWPESSEMDILLRSIPSMVWILQGLVALSGVALLFVRRGSLTLATVSLSMLTAYNLLRFRDFSIIGTANLVALILATLAVLAALYFPRFRKPYIDPRVRWWETAKRYRADLSVEIVGGDESFRLLDISNTGALVTAPDAVLNRLIPGRPLRLHLPGGHELEAEVVREAPAPGEGRAWGLRFTDTSRAARRGLREFLSTLESDPTKLLR